MWTKYVVTISVVFFVACDGGLEAVPPVEPGISGTVIFSKNTWPPIDSVFNLWVFASQIYPLDSNSVFVGLFVPPPRIFLYPTDRDRLAFNVDSVQYIFPLPPAVYKYIGVIQRYRSELSVTSFRVVGLYNNPEKPDQPKQVVVREGELVSGVNMFVDFTNPPTQPF
jgi:hypothetical protein